MRSGSDCSRERPDVGCRPRRSNETISCFRVRCRRPVRHRVRVRAAESDDHRRPGHPVHVRAEFPQASARRKPGASRSRRHQLEGQIFVYTAATRPACSSSIGTALLGRSARATTGSSSRTRSGSTRTTTSGPSTRARTWSPSSVLKGVLMVLGRRPPPVDGPVVFPAGPNQPAQKYLFCRPTDVGLDPQGNIFVSDGYCNNRVVKFDKNGRFVAQVWQRKGGQSAGRVQPASRPAGR